MTSMSNQEVGIANGIVRSRILECKSGQTSLREWGSILQRMIGQECNAQTACCGGTARQYDAWDKSDEI